MVLSVATLITQLYPQLHGSSEADLVFTDDDDMVRLFSDAIKNLAQRFGVFVLRHINRSLVQGQLYYDAPPRHLSTLHVAILETGKPLAASSTKEQELRSTAYETTQATAAKPIRWWIEDKAGVNRVGIVPLPGADDSGNHWDMVYHAYSCNVLEGIETNHTWGDYLSHVVMADLWTPESDFSIPESAKGYRALANLYEAVAEKLWNKAQ